MAFAKRKFLGLGLSNQHKKCAELLESLCSSPCTLTLGHYREICVWMNIAPPERVDFETLSNRYHWHRKEAGLGIREHGLLSAPRTGDRAQALAPPLEVSIYLDNLRSAHNVGSILRSVEAFQLGSLFLSEQTPGTSHRQVQQAAMGTQDWVSVQSCTSLSSLPRPFIALETSDNAHSLYDFQWPQSAFTLIVGNEEYGCSESVLAQADAIVEIPLCGRKNSLNVANALAIVAYDIRRKKNN